MSESLSLGLLCYNDAATIGSLVKGLDETARRTRRSYEILVTDDGSTDGSREVLASLQKEIPALRVILHDKNKGYGAAVRSVFEAAQNDLVFYTDGDGQYDVREFPKLLSLMKDGTGFVNGCKEKRSDPFYRVGIGTAYQAVLRRIFKYRTKDLTCDFRLIRRKALRSFSLQASSGAICLELVSRLERAGFRGVDCPVTHSSRRHGKSQYFNFPRLLETLREILWLQKSLKGPA